MTINNFEGKNNNKNTIEDDPDDIFADRLISIFLLQIQSQKKSSHKSNEVEEDDDSK